MKLRLATIGYEQATVASFLETLRGAGIDLLVDVRAAARSRRPGFAKTALAANLSTAGIEYLHLPGLGTPAAGRTAARGGDFEGMKAVFLDHLQTPQAIAGLHALRELVQSGRNVCILCLEADPTHCHRSLVADAFTAQTPADIEHLHPDESQE
ncbi:MAG: DUF488 domain-containing protein [Gemmatimonadota bacterium]|jgi:uncharacterized protein (DUF488 family)|nr:DUF488 domain-containing protein [Gemmatimonadota bacterium]